MSGLEGIKVVIKMMIKTLNQMGVTLVSIDADQSVPLYIVQLDGKKLIQSVDETLKSTYGILWSLTYGKVTDENRNSKIDLKYELINPEEAINLDDN